MQEKIFHLDVASERVLMHSSSNEKTKPNQSTKNYQI